MAIRDVIWDGSSFQPIEADTLDNIDSSSFLLKTGGTLTGKLLLQNGTGTTGGFSFAGDGSLDTGVFSPADGQLDLYANGIHSARIETTGLRIMPGKDITLEGVALKTRLYQNTSNVDLDLGVSRFIRWRNFGNNHIIFDASTSTSPTGTAVNNTNAQIPWNSTYPTLMGWNGASTYGVRVDCARWADQSGRANSLTCTDYGAPIEAGQYIDFHQVGTNTDYSVRLTGTEGTLNCSGTFSATKVYNAVWNDYAELFEKQDDDLTAGDILAWDKTGVVKAEIKNKKTVVGVYSDSYGHLLGGEENKTEQENLKNFAPVGLVGRVYVKVKGKISKGDFITVSDIPGVGCATTNYEPGTIVGKSLETKESETISRINMMIMTI